MKTEKLLQAVGLSVAVAAGVSSAGSAQLLTVQETEWMEWLPVGIGKPFVGRTFTVCGGSFEMGDLSRVFDVVAKVRLE